MRLYLGTPSANQSSMQVRDHEYYHAQWNVKNAEREKTKKPGREAALAWASLAQRFPASSVLAREGAGCGSVGDVPVPGWPQLRSHLPFGPRSQASLQKAQGPGVCKLPKPPALGLQGDPTSQS